MIDRDLTPKLMRAAQKFPSITLTGPRQSGKTTLCRELFSQHPYKTLEDPDTSAFAKEDPRGFLAQFPEGAIIDEVQRVPEIISYLQGKIDDDPAPGRWILTGSQNLSLLESVSQSLAGRTAVYHLLPLTRGEIMRFDRHPDSLEETLVTGGYPAIFNRGLKPLDWFPSYITTYVERDVRRIINVSNHTTFQRFVELCAGHTAHLLKYSSLANDCGISQPTAKGWLGILETGFITFCLSPFHLKLRKRLVKMPKLLFYDTGLVCWLLGIRTPEQLRSHPLRGSIFETWVISEIAKYRSNWGEMRGLSFYRDRNGAEVDLIVEHPSEHPSRITLIEAKSSQTASPKLFGRARRVQQHISTSNRPCDVVVAYGGDQFQQRADGDLIPWFRLRQAALGKSVFTVVVWADGKPIAGASVLVLFPDGTYTRLITTDEDGVARLDIPSAQQPMTVFAAAEGFSAYVERNWIAAECALITKLRRLSKGGSLISPDGSHVCLPNVTESLTRIFRERHDLGRDYIESGNIAINGQNNSMTPFNVGEEMRLSTQGQEIFVRIVDIVGQSVLVEYRRA